MKKFFCAIAACRYFSSNTTCNTKTRFKNYIKKKNNDPKSPKRTRIKWTDQQSQVLNAISSGKSVFITGSAGTGKTILVEHIIKRLKKIHGRSQVYVTASTGVAACAIGGQTLHSFAGVGFGEADRETLLHKVISDRKAYCRWNKAIVLVIDEISMVNPEFFDKLEYIAREVRQDKEYKCKDVRWGGIQLVVSGDFFQLPPVFTSQQKRRKKVFAFEANCWDVSFDIQIDLTKVFRQSEVQLVELLKGIRRGESDPEHLQLLEQCCSELEADSSVVGLYPRNEDVNRVNKKQLESLGEHIYVYHALDSGEDPWKRQLKQGLAPDDLGLCIGARVMLIKNLNTWRKLANGATGTIIAFEDTYDKDVPKMCDGDSILPLVKFDSGPELVIDPEIWVVMDGEKVVASRKQIPLILAWALSIHKCQGMTLNSLHTDLSRAFGFGMVYVALSRVQTLGGLHLSGFCPSKIKAHPKVLQFYQRFSGGQDKQEEDDTIGLENEISGSNLVDDVSDKVISAGTKNEISDSNMLGDVSDKKMISAGTKFF